LKRAEHYTRFVGEQVVITLKLPFQGRKKYQGMLQAAEGGEGWQLHFNDGKVDQVLDFTLDEVREARLVPVVDFKGRRGKAAPVAPQQADDNSNVGGQEE
jgi:ribosome maturation factor RimP